MNATVCSKTPEVSVRDNRNLIVRTIAYHCHPQRPDAKNERITRHRHDNRRFPASSVDPRLHECGRVNCSYLTSLAGSVLSLRAADDGDTVTLHDVAGRPCFAITNMRTSTDGSQDRSSAVTRTWQYEASSLLGRPLSVNESTTGQAKHVAERFTYASATCADKSRNLAGKCVSHYDTAGRLQTENVALTGTALSVTRKFMKNANDGVAVADWRGQDASAWDALLDGAAYVTRCLADATGACLASTDAKGNVQRVAYGVADRPSKSWLMLKGTAEQVIVQSLTYSAAGHVLREAYGNGIVVTNTYDAKTQNLKSVRTERPAGHPAGPKVLQDLHHLHDPVGNILAIEDRAEATRFWRNQRVAPENTFTYDSLYQLVCTTGREMSGAAKPVACRRIARIPMPIDSSAYTNYTRTYDYDTAGNLTRMHHRAPAAVNEYSTVVTISDRSNRGVLNTLTTDPAVVDALFTPGGQQTRLQPGQSLSWTLRNELQRVVTLARADDDSDQEYYHYDSSGQRVSKCQVRKTSRGARLDTVLYLPALEVRTAYQGVTCTQHLTVVTCDKAGSAQVRALAWECGKPDGIDSHQIRWSLEHLSGSSGLEVDGNGHLISREEYFPYGGTSTWTARCAVEANYKFIRYSRKERDATGLYYYGYRYYQPWAGRWLSSDPAGRVDGLNLFRMCRNNPVTLHDSDGLVPTSKLSDKKQAFVDAAALKLAALIAPTEETSAHKDTLRAFMIEHHPAIKPKRFDELWEPVQTKAQEILKRQREQEIASVSRTHELGRGGDAVTYDQRNGYVVKVFHKPMTDIDQQRREVDIFNRVYGKGSASILSPTLIKMKKIEGVAVSEIGVDAFTQRDADSLVDKLSQLHDKNVLHADLHYGNILYDKESSEFNIIDFGTARIEPRQEILQEEMAEFKNHFIYRWPGVHRRPAPSLLGRNNRLYI